MLNKLWPWMIIVSIFFGLFSGNFNNINNIIFSTLENTTSLIINLIGVMCFWCGIIKILTKTSIMRILEKMLRPIVGKLFKSEELFVIPGKSLSKAAHIAVSYDNSICRYYTPLASTLFQQYIWENNLESPDKSLFSEEPSNKGVLMKNRIDVRNKK